MFYVIKMTLYFHTKFIFITTSPQNTKQREHGTMLYSYNIVTEYIIMPKTTAKNAKNPNDTRTRTI